jgi:hypothetical protein
VAFRRHAANNISVFRDTIPEISAAVLSCAAEAFLSDSHTIFGGGGVALRRHAANSRQGIGFDPVASKQAANATSGAFRPWGSAKESGSAAAGRGRENRCHVLAAVAILPETLLQRTIGI